MYICECICIARTLAALLRFLPRGKTHVAEGESVNAFSAVLSTEGRDVGLNQDLKDLKARAWWRCRELTAGVQG